MDMRIITLIVVAFELTRQEEQCLGGYFGADCQQMCSKNCRPFETFLCDKTTGKCSEGCKSGLYGSTCNLSCNCSGNCIQDTGECTEIEIQSTVSPCVTQVVEADCRRWITIVVISVLWSILVLASAIGYSLFKRRRLIRSLCRSRGGRYQDEAETQGLTREGDAQGGQLEKEIEKLTSSNVDVAHRDSKEMPEQERERDAGAEMTPQLIKERQGLTKEEDVDTGRKHELEKEVNKLKEEKRNLEQEVQKLRGDNLQLEKEIQRLQKEKEDDSEMDTQNQEMHELEKARDAGAEMDFQIIKEVCELEKEKDAEKEKDTEKEKDSEARVKPQHQKELKTPEKEKPVQAGRTQKDTKEMVEERNVFLRNLGLCENSTYHLLKNKLDRSIFLQCIHLDFDTEKVNKSYTSIDNNGELVNIPTDEKNHNTTRFVHYMGTCSNIAISQTGSPQYFEVVADIELNKPLGERDVLLEIAFCKTGDRDVGQFTPRRENCYSYTIAYNAEKQGICVAIADGKKGKYHTLTSLTNKEGSKTTMKFGILADSVGKRVVVFNLLDSTLTATFEKIDYSQHLWPMFGLGNTIIAKITMKIVDGSDIEMEDQKKKMITDMIKSGSKIPNPKRSSVNFIEKH